MSEKNGFDLDDFIRPYEAARAGGAARIEQFLPEPGHPRRAEVLCELVRVELEMDHRAGAAGDLEGYRVRFPDLFADPERLREVAYEDYRLRRQTGDDVSPGEYAERFGIATDDWPDLTRVLPDGAAPDDSNADFLLDLSHAAPRSVPRVLDATSKFPEPGSEIAGFRLLSELGRGAIGRAYLATQGELARRRVVIKLSPDEFFAEEALPLAQLQHTNVMPIYSAHRVEPFVAICMPYLGSVTLAGLLKGLRQERDLPGSGVGLVSTLITLVGDRETFREDTPTPEVTPVESADPPASDDLAHLRSLSYVEAVLWLTEKLADGLAHAHQRGILHRDLKPANILLTDDGQPVLLDFNLAQDVKHPASAAVAKAGGTLPYMAPEYMAGLLGGTPSADARCDVYALGVILYELLTLRFPFPSRSGPVAELLIEMSADRREPPESPRKYNPAVTPAVASIVRTCLEPDPERRYRSAADLREDVRRQLSHQRLRHAPDRSPRERLRKWSHRHPRLSSWGAAGALLGSLLVAAVILAFIRSEQRADLRAETALFQLREDMRIIPALLATPDAEPGQLREGRELCREQAAKFGVLTSEGFTENPLYRRLSESDRAAFRREMGKLVWLWNRSLTWGGEGGDEFIATLGSRAESWFDAGTPPAVIRDWEAYRSLHEQLAAGEWREALPVLREATAADSDTASDWVLLGHCLDRLGRHAEAALCYKSAATRLTENPWVWVSYGFASYHAGDFDLAVEGFDRALDVRPDWPIVLMNRGLAELRLGNHQAAITDLTRARDSGEAPTRVHFILAEARARSSDVEGAKRDRETGLAATPTDARSWIARGVARLRGDPEGALADFREASEVDPTSEVALRNQAHVLSEHLDRPEDAIAVLDAAVERYPDEPLSRAGRAVLLARLGRRDEAHRDAEAVLEGDADGGLKYQIAGVYALTSRTHPGDAAVAFRLLKAAMLADAQWLGVAPRDPDLAAVRDSEEYRRIVAAATELHGDESTGR